MSQTDNYR